MRKILIWFCAIVLAAFTASQAFALVAAKKGPLTALLIYPQNGFALGHAADALLKEAVLENEGAMPGTFDPQISMWAKQGFAAEPAAYAAIRMKALDYAADGETDKAQRLVRAMQKLTRRDRVANFWLVEDYGKREDLPNMLKYYDLTLRTSNSAREILVPQLVSVMDQSEAVGPMSELLAKDPSWADQFWGRLVRTKSSLPHTGLLRMQMITRQIAPAQEIDDLLVKQLVRYRHFDRAYEVAQALTPGEGKETKRTAASASDRTSVLQNADFSSQPVLAPFDWDIISTGEYGAAVDTKAGQLIISALSDSSGIATRQLFKAQPGQYKLVAKAAEGPSGEASLSIQIRCAELPNTRNLLKRLEWSEKELVDTINLSQSFCRFFWLEVSISNPPRSDANDIILDSVNVHPL